MAALGALTDRDPVIPKPVLIPITDYTVERGNYLGVITTRNPVLPAPALHSALGTYIVRQIGTVYRQLWPTHGQRFPQ